MKLRELDNAETALKRRQRLDKEAGRMETDDVSDEQKAVQAAQIALEGSLDPELVQDVGCNPSGQYELAAVLTHIGRTADSGHYIGWAKKGDTDEWYKYDDDKVSPVHRDDIMKLDGGGESTVSMWSCSLSSVSLLLLCAWKSFSDYLCILLLFMLFYRGFPCCLLGPLPFTVVQDQDGASQHGITRYIHIYSCR